MTVEESWFRKDEAAAGASVSEIVKHYWETEGRQRREIANLSLALFAGNMKYSLTGGSSILSVVDSLLQDPSAYNLIQASVGTMVANLTQNRVRPLYVTEAGDYALRERAAALQSFTEGEFHEHELYGELGLEVCLYGMMFEGGGVDWFADVANERVIATLAQPWEYYVPKREARTLRPRQTFNRTVIDRGELLAYYADADKETIHRIEDAEPAKQDDAEYDTYRDGSISDMIVISKAWHLPSGRVDLDDERSFGRGKDGRSVSPGHDGRHMCTLADGFVLASEPWPYAFFPQSWFLPNRVPGHFWSRGLPEILAPVQLTMNRWNERMDRIIERHARPLLVTWKNAKIAPARITNELASILESQVPPGQAMQYLQSPGVPPELMQRVAQLRADGRDQIGLSELAMEAKRPQGLTSAPPMRHLQDRENVRHGPEYKAWDRFFLSSARNDVRCMREIARQNPDYEVAFGNDKELKRQKWADMNLEDDKFKLKTHPTNLFATDPAARSEQQIEWMNAGLITKEQALTNMDNPDSEAILGDTMAPERNIERRLDAIIKANEYTAELMPTPYMDLDLAKRLVVRRLNRIEADGESQDKIDRLVAFEQDIDDISAQRASKLAEAAARAAQVTQQSANPGLAAPNAPPPQPIQPGPPAGAPMQQGMPQ
jgi:hypothetical protein